MLHVLASATAAKVPTVSFDFKTENLQRLEDAHQSLGLFQHHDAITGNFTKVLIFSSVISMIKSAFREFIKNSTVKIFTSFPFWKLNMNHRTNS